MKNLREILGQHGNDGNDHAYLVELEPLKRQFGRKWDLMAEKIHKVAREVIESHISAADAYASCMDASYLVSFAQLSPQEIRLKLVLIAKELARRLIGAESAYGEIKIKKAAISGDGKIAFGEIESVGTAAGDPSIRHSVKDERQLAAKPQLWTGEIIEPDKIQFIYRPLLSLRGMVVSTYVCLAIKQDARGSFCSGYRILPDQSDAMQVADLDLLSLATVAVELSFMMKTKTRALLSLPIHFETLANGRNRTKHLDYCNKHLKKYADRLIFELVELPEGVPQFRLVELVGMLHPFARAVIARFKTDRKTFALCRSAGLHAVGMDIHDHQEGEAALIRQFNRFVEAANKERLKTYVHGIHTISLNTAAIAAGFDYIDGYALTSVARSPVSAQRYDLRSMYMPLLGKPHHALDSPPSS